MLRNRFLIFLGGCFLAASAAWADDVGYVDCSSHSDGTQVFAKPRQTPDVLASMPCGERFTILVYGFVFSRIQTSDGKVGYVYSNVIVVDRNAAAVRQPAPARVVTASDKVAVPRAPVEKTSSPSPAQPQPAPAQMTQQQAAPAATSAPTLPTPSSATTAASVPQTPATSAQPDPVSSVQPQTAPAQPAPVPEPAPSAPVTITPPAPASPAVPTSSEAASTAAQPDPPAAAQPQPESAQPVAPAVRPANANTTWQRPLPSVRPAPLFEVFGGYAFARLDGGGGAATNMNGGIGSFGWNFKPWLQIVGDSSYSFVTIGTTKNVLYGNHFGARYFHRSRNRWGATPFVEGLVGGSRADTTVTGTGGYTASSNCLSYKVGGGLDLRPSRRWEIRVFDFDYYRTSFGTNVHQNNYWVSAGIVLRLFGGGAE